MTVCSRLDCKESRRRRGYVTVEWKLGSGSRQITLMKFPALPALIATNTQIFAILGASTLAGGRLCLCRLGAMRLLHGFPDEVCFWPGTSGGGTGLCQKSPYGRNNSTAAACTLLVPSCIQYFSCTERLILRFDMKIADKLHQC